MSVFYSLAKAIKSKSTLTEYLRKDYISQNLAYLFYILRSKNTPADIKEETVGLILRYFDSRFVLKGHSIFIPERMERRFIRFIKLMISSNINVPEVIGNLLGDDVDQDFSVIRLRKPALLALIHYYKKFFSESSTVALLLSYPVLIKALNVQVVVLKRSYENETRRIKSYV